MRNLRRHMLLWRKVHRRDKSDCGHQVERTQHPIHRKIGPIQTSLQQRHTHLHMENPDESSSKTPTKKNFRKLFYCKIQAKNQRSKCSQATIFISEWNNLRNFLHPMDVFIFQHFNRTRILTIFQSICKQNIDFLKHFQLDISSRMMSL